MDATITRLILVRHGESRSNAEGWISGNDTCGGLTDNGRVQAARLRDRLAASGELRPDVVLSSTMTRAIETAEILEPALGGGGTRQVHEFSERFPGECEGMTQDEYRAKYDRHPYADPIPAMSPGGEDADEFLRRVRGAIGAVVEEHAGRTIVVVCHGGVIVGAASLLTEGGFTGVLRWAPPQHTSISQWVHGWGPGDDPWLLERYNDHSHVLG